MRIKFLVRVETDSYLEGEGGRDGEERQTPVIIVGGVIKQGG